jgi:uncharacterized protein YbaA (DUF1428 family)
VRGGKVTDSRRGVKAEPLNIVFAFMEWPSRAMCDAAHEEMKKDELMKLPEGVGIPLNPERMIYAHLDRDAGEAR